MAVIKPFRGIRYNPDLIKDLAAVITPPYDVINPAAQEKLHKNSIYNIIRLEFGRSKPDDNESENRYTRASKTISHWLQENVLMIENSFSYYFYEQRFLFNETEYRRRGLIAALRLEEYSSRIILPHELTMSGPKKDRLELLSSCHTNISPIFTLFPDHDCKIANIYDSIENETLLFDIKEDSGQSHRVWQITNPGLQDQLTANIANQLLLIADGHHRYETALNYLNQSEDRRHTGAGYILAVLVSMKDPGLLMLPTHRLLSSMNDRQMDTLLKLIKENFLVIDHGNPRSLNHDFYLNELKSRADQCCIGFLAAEKACLLIPIKSAAGSDLPVSILHEHLLKPVFEDSISTAGAEEIIGFSHQFSSTLQAVIDKTADAAFILDTIPVGDVLDRALSDRVMPQKSTYFYPKLPSGLILHHHDLSH